jgi:hypothetical protein
MKPFLETCKVTFGVNYNLGKVASQRNTKTKNSAAFSSQANCTDLATTVAGELSTDFCG